MFRKLLSMMLVILVVSITLSTGVIGAATQDDQAIAKIAQKNNIQAGKLKIAESSKKELPLTGVSIDVVKAIDESTGNVYRIAIDKKGNEVDLEKAFQNEADAQKKKTGKLDAALADKLNSAKKDEAIDVAIWLNEGESKLAEKYAKKAISGKLTDETSADDSAEPVDGSALGTNKEDVASITEQANKERADEVSAVVAPIADELRKKGSKVEVDSKLPIIYTTLKPAEIKDLSNRKEVNALYADAKADHTLNVAVPTINANIVQGRNIEGWGVKVGEIEVGGQASTSNPYLTFPPFLNDITNSCFSTHSTAVAGIIKSTHPTYYGTSPGVNLRVGGSCFGNILQLTQANDRAVGWGARISTNSWADNLVDGNRHFDDRYYDAEMFNPPWLLPIVAAGNTGGRVTSPGLQYNGITVGAFDDHGTVSWIGDTMAPFSAFIDGNNGMEKPEVVAPGVNFISTTQFGVGSVGSGTSYATPMVAGEAALLLNRNPGLLTLNPEATKAIIMASAVHNLDDGVPGNGLPFVNEKDGAGGVVADRADNIARGINGNAGELFYTCSSPSPVTLTTMPLIAGVPTRAVMTFSSNPNFIFDAFNPSADLDITVVNPFGSTVAFSLSADNTYEIVGFTPTVTGNYQLRMNKFSCSSVNYVGWAWYRGT